MAAIFAVNLRGTKEECSAQIDAQVPETEISARQALHSLIDAAPGNRVSLQGALNKGPDGQTGNVNIQGSFWTKE